MEEITYDNIDCLANEALELQKQGKIKVTKVYLDLPNGQQGILIDIPGVGKCTYVGD